MFAHSVLDKASPQSPDARGQIRVGQLAPWLCFLLFAIHQFSVTRGWAQIIPLQMHALTVLAVNISLVACGLLLLESIVDRFWIAAFIAMCAATTIAVANRVKINLLGIAVEPAKDVHRIGDVLPFLGDVFFHWQTLLFLLFLSALGLLAIFLNRHVPVATWNGSKRLYVGSAAFAVLAVVPALAPYLPLLHLYEQASTNWVFCCGHDGVPLAYLANLGQLGRRPGSIHPPPGYGPDRVQSICNRIQNGYQPSPPVRTFPDIVMIAAEAMMDPTTLPNLSHPVDWLSSVHHLQQQAGPYRLISPSLGGMSINADFEVVTGFSTRFIGTEDDCASDHLEHAIPSLARVLKSRGYETIAIVPTSPTLFRHSYVFRNVLGFDRAIFEDEMGTHMGETPDAEIAKLIVREINAPSPRPRFIYAQFERNHSPWDGKKHYDHGWVVPSSPLAGADALSFNIYIQGVYETDQVIGDLAGSLQKRGKPVVMAVYGDHLPAIGTSALRTLGVFDGNDGDSPQNALPMHTTPGLIWTPGGPAAVAHAGVTGMNYFTAYVLKTAGISHPFYTGFLLEAHDALPAFNHHVICAPGSRPVASFPPESLATVDDYELLQYDMVYGRQFAAASLFPEMVPR